MVEYELNVMEPWKTMIKQRRKTIEGRVYKNKWKEVVVGDTFRVDDQLFTVKDIQVFENFYKMFDKAKEEGWIDKLLPDNPYEKIYEDIYYADVLWSYEFAIFTLE